MSYFHDSMGAQHQGTQRMMFLMRHRVHWKGMQQDLIEYVGDCKSCKLGKATPNKREGFLKLFEATKPFEVVHLDLVGPLPVTKSGNRYVLTMMDRFSRMIKLVPVPVQTASCVAMAFRTNWLLQYGTPDKILTDRGSNFTGLIFNILRKLQGFEALFTTSYHPRTNGRLERFHRFLKSRLRILAHSKGLDFLAGDEWDIYLGDIAFAYNTTPNRMTKHTPYDIVYGGIVKLPIDRVFKFDVDDVATKAAEEFRNPMDARMRPLRVDAEHRSYIKLMNQHRQILQKEIIANQKEYGKKMKKQFDSKRVPPRRYRVNQDIYVDQSVGKVGNSKKLGINRKHGIIMDKIGANTYVVRYDDGRTEPVNVERMYTISVIDAKPSTRHSHRKYKRRSDKRRSNKRRREMDSDSNPKPSKRSRQ